MKPILCLVGLVALISISYGTPVPIGQQSAENTTANNTVNGTTMTSLGNSSKNETAAAIRKPKLFGIGLGLGLGYGYGYPYGGLGYGGWGGGPCLGGPPYIVGNLGGCAGALGYPYGYWG